MPPRLSPAGRSARAAKPCAEPCPFAQTSARGARARESPPNERIGGGCLRKRRHAECRGAVSSPDKETSSMQRNLGKVARLSAVVAALWLFVTALALGGCGGPSDTGPPDGPKPCGAGELTLKG